MTFGAPSYPTPISKLATRNFHTPGHLQIIDFELMKVYYTINLRIKPYLKHSVTFEPGKEANSF